MLHKKHLHQRLDGPSSGDGRLVLRMGLRCPPAILPSAREAPVLRQPSHSIQAPHPAFAPAALSVVACHQQRQRRPGSRNRDRRGSQVQVLQPPAGMTKRWALVAAAPGAECHQQRLVPATGLPVSINVQDMIFKEPLHCLPLHVEWDALLKLVHQAFVTEYASPAGPSGGLPPQARDQDCPPSSTKRRLAW